MQIRIRQMRMRIRVCRGARRKTGFKSESKLRRISFARRPRSISWCYFEAIGLIQTVTKQFQDTGSIESKPGQGRPRTTTTREDRNLSTITRRNRGNTVSQLSRYLYAAAGTRVTRVTVSKRLYESKLLARRPAVCVPLMSTNRRVRLEWCRQH
ncbi:HTH_Tnp_Tc3_2 domain-containing protein [Trichonephila clavipes]|nr:HTH_Tnp_Tc3_2 domain-containing protein [Trichonephila clavipes]